MKAEFILSFLVGVVSNMLFGRLHYRWVFFSIVTALWVLTVFYAKGIL